jgi:hypothetical protein
MLTLAGDYLLFPDKKIKIFWPKMKAQNTIPAQSQASVI